MVVMEIVSEEEGMKLIPEGSVLGKFMSGLPSLNFTANLRTLGNGLYRFARVFGIPDNKGRN